MITSHHANTSLEVAIAYFVTSGVGYLPTDCVGLAGMAYVGMADADRGVTGTYARPVRGGCKGLALEMAALRRADRSMARWGIDR